MNATEYRLHGAVVKIMEDNVHCELYLNSGNITVELPETLFAQPIIWGQPIWLQVYESHGFYRVAVIKRELSKDGTHESR